MILSLSMYFDEDTYFDEYPDLTENEQVLMMKQDFIDTIVKQWDYDEQMEAIEVADD